jgi:hypothetical protein
MTVVEGNRPVVAELDECVPRYSWEPRAVLAHGTKTPDLAEGVVGVVVHIHLQKRPRKHTNPKVIISKNKYKNWNKVNRSKEKAKAGLF